MAIPAFPTPFYQNPTIPYVPKPVAPAAPATPGSVPPPSRDEIRAAFAQRFPVIAAGGQALRDFSSRNPQFGPALAQMGASGLAAASQATGNIGNRRAAILSGMISGFNQGMQPPPELEWENIPTPQGETGQWQRSRETGELRRVGGNGQLVGDINVNAGDTNKWRDAVAGRTGEIFGDNIETGLAAQQRLIQLNELEANLADVEGGTGFWANLRGVAAGWGIDLAGDAEPLQISTAIIQSLIPEFRPPASGTFTDEDARRVEQSLPALSNTPGGNALILRSLKGIAGYQAAVANVIMEGLEDPDMTLPELYRRIGAIPDPIAELRQTEAFQQAANRQEAPEEAPAEEGTQRPADATAQAINATISAWTAAGYTEQEALQALADRFGVSVVQIMEWRR